MSLFTLDVRLQCSGELREPSPVGACSCAMEMATAIADETWSDDKIAIGVSSSVFLSLDGVAALEESLPRTRLIAVFVPPSLTESLEFRQRGKRAGNCQTVFWLIAGKHDHYCLLRKVHPFLADNGRVRGILSVEQAASDILLFDVNDASPMWTSHILNTLNGESLEDYPELVLKLIPLSNLRFQNDGATETPTSGRRQIPACPVCLYRVDPQRFGLSMPKEHQLCSKGCIQETGFSPGLCRNHRLLRPWPPPSCCTACHVIQSRWNTPHFNMLNGRNEVASLCVQDETEDIFCNRCALMETLWTCLTCGFVGCGRYSQRHAAEHFQETGHPFSLELATLRIWDYINSEFVHRGDFLECPSIQSLHLQPSAAGRKSIQGDEYGEAMMPRENPYPVSLDEPSPKKANMIGEEYEALLQSALEDQAQHYEGELTRLRAALTAESVDQNQITKEESQEVDSLKADIARYRAEIDRLGRQLLDAQGQEAGYRSSSQRLLREQSVATDLLDKIRGEAAKENEEGERQVAELEQQIEDLTANLRMRRQFSQDQELNNAQIFGAVGTKAGKKGRRNRRFFRK
jgi:hypothetical protein